MWCCSPRFPSLSVIVVVALAVAGCGFRPIYGGGGGGQTTQALADVDVTPVEDRVGQLLYNRLLDRINPGGRPSNPRYRLETSLTESISELGFQKNEFATRANLHLHAQYILYAVASGEVLVSSSETVVASYNVLNSDFATLASENEARRRAARELADEIVVRLGLYFSAEKARTAGAS